MKIAKYSKDKKEKKPRKKDTEPPKVKKADQQKMTKHAQDIIKQISVTLPQLRSVLMTELTQQLRDKVPAYILAEAEAAKTALEKLSSDWDPVLSGATAPADPQHARQELQGHEGTHAWEKM